MAKSSAKTAVTVRIGGEDHTIRANVEPEYTRRCAQWVDDRISEIKNQLGLIESHKAAILAALSISDELFQARAEAEELRDAATSRAEGLALRLEKALAELVEPEPDAVEVGDETGEGGDEVAGAEEVGVGPQAED